MQDIVFYAVANETLGSVRDYANARKRPAPILTLGVSVCLRMRLFAAQNDATPYPMDSFNGIVDWQWRMDDDLDRNTTCKLVADADSISVHTANGVFDGSTLHFTEFVIPISNMNTQELATWIGNEKKRSGLTGELVGYDNAGNAVFVLQIENFTIRNRVGGLGDPTAMDQEVVTRTQAESLIQAAVSASADTKQDKLNFSNAGTGISISSNGVISTDDVPQSVVTGLSASLAAKQNNISAGDLMEISGTTVNRKRYMNIIADSSIITRTITPEGSQTSVSAYVMEPGNAYKINVTSSAKWLATTAAFKDSTGTWGIEGHIELFVAGTGYVRTDSNVILADALEPDAVNNCTLRFHDGKCIISVEDHVYGYIVVSATGTTAGTLPYALHDVSSEYIAFDASLNGQTLDLGGATTYAGEKHVVGNGYTETVLSGGIVCTSKTTFSNLSMNGVVVSSGTLTLGDVFVQNVAVSGGGLAVEKVTGDGTGVVDLGATTAIMQNGSASGCTFTNGGSSGATSGAFLFTDGMSAQFTSCTFSGNTAATRIGAIGVACDTGKATVFLSGCTFSGNTLNDIAMKRGAKVAIVDCSFLDNIANIYNYSNASATFGGTIVYKGRTDKYSTPSGEWSVSSGAVIDFTGNENATPWNPGCGVTFAPGGANVYPSAGSASAYMLDGMTVPQIGNTNVVNLGGTNVTVSGGGTAYASGCTFTGGSGGIRSSNATVYLSSCTISGMNGAYGGGGAVNSGGTLTLDKCIVTANYGAFGGGVYAGGSSVLNIDNSVISGNSTTDIRLTDATINMSGSTVGYIVTSGGTVVITGENRVDKIMSGGESAVGAVSISSGAVVDLTGNTNTTPINPGGGITFAPGGATVYPSAGQASAYMLDNLTVASLSNTNYLNKLVQPYGGKVSGAIFSGLANSFGGAVQLNNSTFEAEGCSFYDNTCLNNKGGAMYLAGCTASVSNCVFSGNAVANWQDGLAIYMGSNTNGSAHCTIGDCDFQGVPPGGSKGSYFIYINGGGTAVFSGTNINPITKVVDGELTITSGAIVDLTGTSAGTPIIANAENGIINIVGGGDDLPTVIRDSAGHIHTFDYADIQGSTITNLGFVYGAAVTFLDSTADYLVYYTTDDGTTYSSATVNGSTGTYTVTGALVQLNKVG